jgi:hypothetical protein
MAEGQELLTVELTADDRALLSLGLGLITGQGIVDTARSIDLANKLGVPTPPRADDQPADG